MVKVHKQFAAGKAEIDAAIAAAEKGTTGELVVVATPRAGSYAHAESAFAFAVSLVAFAATWILGQKITYAEWTSMPGIFIGVWASCLVLIAGYVVGQIILKLFPRIGPLLTSKRHIAEEVERAAAYAFRKFHVEQTKGATGVLIFVAELERTVVVMGDATIAREVKTEEWEAARDAILAGIKQGQPIEGLKNGIGKAGDLLRTHCPCREDEDSDELTSEMHLS